jgi:hypothetical protein
MIMLKYSLLIAGCALQWRSKKEGKAYMPMTMPSWTAMLNSQLFLLSGAANLAAGKLVGIEILAEIGVEKIDQLIMPCWTAMLNSHTAKTQYQACIHRKIA